MIKNWKTFINESNNIKITLSDEDIEIFSSEPVLKNLISQKKVFLLPPHLSYDDNDMDTVNVLKEYITMEKVDESKINEFFYFQVNSTGGTWDTIYDEYCKECLNTDGDYSMQFIDWLKSNYEVPESSNLNKKVDESKKGSKKETIASVEIKNIQEWSDFDNLDKKDISKLIGKGLINMGIPKNDFKIKVTEI